MKKPILFHYTAGLSGRRSVMAQLKRRAAPLAALVIATALTFPVIAVGTETYVLSDGETTEKIAVYQGDAQTALSRSAQFPAADYFISAVHGQGNTFDVTVKQKHTIIIQADGNSMLWKTGDGLVSNILREAGVTYSEDDIVEPEPDTKLTEPVTIRITRVKRERKTETQAIPYETQTRTTGELNVGESRVTREGVVGTKELIYEYVYEDDQLISKTQVGELVVKEAVDEIIETGTGTAVPTTASGTASTTGSTAANSSTSSGNTVRTSSGGMLSYSKVLSMEATAYCDDGYTASGTKARVGEVAVDPDVIPLGTKLYITSSDGSSWVYGTAVAEDTGGAIKGNRIDLYFNTEAECNAFGRQQALVYILT